MDIVTVVRIMIALLLIALVVILITRRLAVPYTLGLVVVGLLISLVEPVPVLHLTPELVLFVFLPALLFEGAWFTRVRLLRENWTTIFLLAVPGLLLALVLIAVPLYFFIHLTWGEALLLAAILSPTDPVAVLGLFRQLKVDERLSTIIEGESLFNDGMAGALYQVFLALVLTSVHGQAPTLGQASWQGIETLIVEVGEGVLIGGVCGFLVSRLVRFIDDPLIETTITLIVAYGVYLIADFLHSSGILAVIVAGLILGSYGRAVGMSEHTSEAVDDFWTMAAFLANALLFLLVGVQLNPTEFLTQSQAGPLLLVAALAILAVLLTRFVVVALLPRVLPQERGRLRSWRFMIFWSGLRGALSLALVLALPLEVPDRPYFIFATYAVVLFTLLVQGFSLRFILHRLPGINRNPQTQ